MIGWQSVPTSSLQGGTSDRIVGLGRIWSVMFHHLAHLISQSCQFPIGPSRTRQKVEQPKSKSTQPIQPDGPPCTVYTRCCPAEEDCSTRAQNAGNVETQLDQVKSSDTLACSLKSVTFVIVTAEFSVFTSYFHPLFIRGVSRLATFAQRAWLRVRKHN